MTTATDLRAPEEATIIIRRVVDAPRELVFEAFTDPKHLAQFWGPKGYGASKVDVDLRVGGQFRVEMRGPDGGTYPAVGVYREISPPERIVYAGLDEDLHPCGGGLPPRAIVTMSFADEGGKTRITVHTQLQSVAARDAATAGGFSIGWNESLERLAAYLARRAQ